MKSPPGFLFTSGHSFRSIKIYNDPIFTYIIPNRILIFPTHVSKLLHPLQNKGDCRRMKKFCGSPFFGCGKKTTIVWKKEATFPQIERT